MKKCRECKRKITGKPIEEKPCRHFCSPSPATWKESFCSVVCRNKYQKRLYAELAKFDRNASDSECFVHDHWETETYTGVDGKTFDIGIKIRVGTCKITGNKVTVEPLQPGETSGQPIECYNHFVLRECYRKALGK